MQHFTGEYECTDRQFELAIPMPMSLFPRRGARNVLGAITGVSTRRPYLDFRLHGDDDWRRRQERLPCHPNLRDTPTGSWQMTFRHVSGNVVGGIGIHPHLPATTPTRGDQVESVHMARRRRFRVR